MKHLDLSLPHPAGNLALDEALLEGCETGRTGAALRFWESPVSFVVVGYANAAAREVDLDACRALGVPVLRRISGGGTVVQGPGCLNYTLVVPIATDPAWEGITTTNQRVMEVHAHVTSQLLGREVRREGDTDLAVGGVKFSGNAQRRKLRSLVFHGTFLLDFDLALIERLLPMPSRQPGYRQERAHGAFVANVPLERAALKAALAAAWQASEPLEEWPMGPTQQLVREKYSRDDWNLKC